jgi:hypothetical protein
MENYSVERNTLLIGSNFCGDLDEKLKNIIITNNITRIIYNSDKCELLNQLNFQGSDIKSLCINISLGSRYYNFGDCQYIPFSKLYNLPKKLEILEITNNMDILYPYDNIFNNLPSKLKTLKLNYYYEDPLENLPNTLENLDVTCRITHKNLLDYLPSSLKNLIVRINSYSSITNSKLNFDSLPSTLECLKILGLYDGELNCLPQKLKILHLPSEFKNEIINVPGKLEELKIPIKYNFLEKIVFNCVGLKKIIIGFSNKSHCNYQSDFDLTKIPKSIEEIIFGDNFNQVLCELLPNLKKITFGFNFNQYSINFDCLSQNISYIEFGYNFNGFVEQYPKNLKHLKFGRNFNKSIDNLPEGLVSLSIGEFFNILISKLPSTLEILEFDYFSGYSFDIEIIPDSTHTIIFSKYMKTNKINIPKKMTNIIYAKNNITITHELLKINFQGSIAYCD